MPSSMAWINLRSISGPGRAKSSACRQEPKVGPCGSGPTPERIVITGVFSPKRRWHAIPRRLNAKYWCGMQAHSQKEGSYERKRRYLD